MKKMILILALIAGSFTVNAQNEDCNLFWKDRVDDIERKKYLEVVSPIKKGSSVITMMIGDRNTVIMSFFDRYMSCIKEGSRIVFALDDNTSMDLYHDGDFRCDGGAVIYFGNVFRKHKQWDKLKERKVVAIRIYTMRNPVDIEFSEEMSELFNSQIRCINL